MFSNLLRQQARLALSTRLTVPLRQQSKKSVLALSTQTSRILSQRTFSISRSLFEEAPANSYSQTGRASAATQGRRASLYVGNLPYSVEEGELRELFEPYGTVERVSLVTDAEGRQRGFGFVEFQSPEAAAAVVESAEGEAFVLSNRELRLSIAENSLRSGRNNREKAPAAPNSTIHIANYPKPGDDRPLRQMLSEYSDQILRVHFMKDRSGNDTEKAFVQFKSVETAVTVLEKFQDKPLEGTYLKIYYALERNRGQSRPRESSRY